MLPGQPLQLIVVGPAHLVNALLESSHHGNITVHMIKLHYPAHQGTSSPLLPSFVSCKCDRLALHYVDQHLFTFHAGYIIRGTVAGEMVP